MAGSEVRVWEEDVVIPTYGIGEPDRNPMFLEKRVYQGSSGAVYPFPVIDKINDVKTDQTWRAVFLENRYLKIMMLPQLGGRVQMALDKTNDHHFIYYNRVIKPALVGLAGPWISGGIEFNWPQHHRPTTYMPVEHALKSNADGSATICIGEIDRMYGTRCFAEFTLYPDRAYLELSVKLSNRTPLPQTFLWWANPAVHVDENHQSVFPPDVHAVMDHGKRDVSSFPIATGTYYKVNYAPGTDISRYKNVPVPTSYMAHHSDFDFVASYDHKKRAGLLHIADHHIAPGKKQWTWGCSDFGKAWDRQLTDEDGPYIELMCGVFTDNQPDFSWMHPYEEKSFKQYFMPYKQIGRIKNANINAAINLEVENGKAYVAAYVTSPRKNLHLRLTDALGTTLFEKRGLDLAPESAFETTFPLAGLADQEGLFLSLLDESGQTIVSYKPARAAATIPSPAQPARPPEEVESIEQLFLTGLHLEQYRHATYSPESYYREALRREPTDVRNNNALGLLLYRRGLFTKAEEHFRTAITTLIARNPNPYDGEPYYNLGLSLKMQGRLDEAFTAFARAAWSAPQQASAFFSMAQIASTQKRYAEAIQFVDQALIYNAHNHKARVLKAALLRLTGDLKQARAEALSVHSLDTLDFGALNELSLIATAGNDPAGATEFDEQLARLAAVRSCDARVASFVSPQELATQASQLQDFRDDEVQVALTRALHGEVQNYIELTLDYVAAGLYQAALDVLGRLTGPGDYPTVDYPMRDYPMVDYLAGWINHLDGKDARSIDHFRSAAGKSSYLCFPNRLEEMLALQTARVMNPSDGMAAYYLGNLFYSKRAYDAAIDAWETARDLCPNFPTVHRNLGLAYFNKRHQANLAQAPMEKAFELDPTDARVLFELDQLYRKINRSPRDRVAFLEKHEDLAGQRDDLYLERIYLLLLLEDFQRVQKLIAARNFHPWEGGEGKVSGAYVASLLGIAKQALQSHNYAEALASLNDARVYPPNLGEGKLYGAVENHLDYFSGVALRGMNRPTEAQASFECASTGLETPTSAMFYNDQPPDMIFYQGLALRALSRQAEADARFNRLIDFGREHLLDTPTVDFFAVSLPEFLVFEDDLTLRNRVHCNYMMGLGELGLSRFAEARSALQTVLKEDASHVGATTHLRMLEWMEKERA